MERGDFWDDKEAWVKSRRQFPLSTTFPAGDEEVTNVEIRNPDVLVLLLDFLSLYPTIPVDFDCDECESLKKKKSAGAVVFDGYSCCCRLRALIFGVTSGLLDRSLCTGTANLVQSICNGRYRKGCLRAISAVVERSRRNRVLKGPVLLLQVLIFLEKVARFFANIHF